jgi:hypothetical protein
LVQNAVVQTLRGQARWAFIRYAVRVDALAYAWTVAVWEREVLKRRDHKHPLVGRHARIQLALVLAASCK